MGLYCWPRQVIRVSLVQANQGIPKTSTSGHLCALHRGYYRVIVIVRAIDSVSVTRIEVTSVQGTQNAGGGCFGHSLIGVD